MPADSTAVISSQEHKHSIQQKIDKDSMLCMIVEGGMDGPGARLYLETSRIAVVAKTLDII